MLQQQSKVSEEAEKAREKQQKEMMAAHEQCPSG